MTHDVTDLKVGDLFEPEPATWGLRGDPHLWRALRQHLSGRNLPASTEQLVDLLNAAFEELVGVDLHSDAAPSVYRERFAHGGMSSGMVSLDMWREQLMPTLMQRASMLMNDGGPTSRALSSAARARSVASVVHPGSAMGTVASGTGRISGGESSVAEVSLCGTHSANMI